MDQNIVLTTVELFISILFEGVILSFVFMWISNKQQNKQEQVLKAEMQNIEKQNKFDFEQLQAEIRLVKTDLVNEIRKDD